MSEALTQREFDTWREEDTAFKQEIRAYISVQSEINLGVERRLSTVETQHQKDVAHVSRRTTWISSIVAAIIGGASGWLAK